MLNRSPVTNIMHLLNDPHPWTLCYIDHSSCLLVRLPTSLWKILWVGTMYPACHQNYGTLRECVSPYYITPQLTIHLECTEEQRKINIFIGLNLPLFILKIGLFCKSRNILVISIFVSYVLMKDLSFSDTINQHRTLMPSYMLREDLCISHKDR